MHFAVHLLRLEANQSNRHAPAWTTFGPRPFLIPSGGGLHPLAAVERTGERIKWAVEIRVKGTL